MNRNDLIAALQEECRVDQTRIEDVLCALSDLCADALEKGQPFHIGDIGFLAIDPRVSHKGKGLRAAVTFRHQTLYANVLIFQSRNFGAGIPESVKSAGAGPARCASMTSARSASRRKTGWIKGTTFRPGPTPLESAGQPTDGLAGCMHAENGIAGQHKKSKNG